MRAVLLIALLLLNAAANAKEFSSAELCPGSVQIGDFSTIEVTTPDFSDTYNETVICTVEGPCSAGSVVNGIPTIVTYDDGGLYPGRLNYFTSDDLGFRFHRFFIPDVFIPGLGYYESLTMTYSPPALVLPSSFDLGESWDRVGKRTNDFSDGSSLILTYETTARALRREAITVAFGGPFESVVVETTTNFRFEGELVDSATSVDWVVPGLCAVYEESVASDGVVTTQELVDSSAVYTPEPSSAFLQISSLLVLALLARLRRREKIAR